MMATCCWPVGHLCERKRCHFGAEAAPQLNRARDGACAAWPRSGPLTHAKG
jgi:hypothetical protein